MKMIIMVTPWLYKRTAHLAHFDVVEVDELDEGVPQRQADQFDRSCLIVDRVRYEHRAAWPTILSLRTGRMSMSMPFMWVAWSNLNPPATLMFPMPNFRSSIACHSRST